MDLFQHAADQDLSGAPLAARMRPRTLDEVCGQDHLVGDGGLLQKFVKAGRLPSLLFWGPPGTGKTTLAEILGRTLSMRFVKMSAVLSGVAQLRQEIEGARRAQAEHRQRTLLFIDEIHRFNKAQQDALLPHVERGVVTLVGATTENPSFEVNAALLSRMRVVVTHPLDDDALMDVARRALVRDTHLAALKLTLGDNTLQALVQASAGDARRLLTALEVATDLAAQEGTGRLEPAHVEQALARRVVLFDKGGDQHYNIVSAFIKSMRGSDPDAALHYMARMLEAGEDPRFVLRRMVIFASEDVGNADPQALQVATAALSAYELMGMPEGALPLTQAVTYLALAPKSNAVLVAYTRARKDVLEHEGAPVPKHILNAPTKLMSGLGYGKGYKYPHDFDGAVVPGRYLPDVLAGRRYYEPKDRGFETELRARLDHIREVLNTDGD